MFTIGKGYTKNDIYSILDVPISKRKGAWDTGYRKWINDIYIFTNVGIPGRTGHNYNNFWDGDLFVWEAKTNSNINHPIIRRMLNPIPHQNNFLFTRTNDKDPFTYEGKVIVKEYKNISPVQIIWQLKEDHNYPIEISKSSENFENNILHEGSVKQIVVNKYERNPLARRLCIEHYGAFCHVCKFDFYKIYGELGKDFIHVHHIIPLSTINKDYVLDPIKDLIPICPNCHSMAHRRKETLSIAELKSIINKEH